MSDFEVGRVYLIETPTFFFLGKVKEVGPLKVFFEKNGCQANWINDMPTLLEKGKFANGDEYFPIPHEFNLPFMWVGQTFDFPHPIPAKRSHPPVE